MNMATKPTAEQNVVVNANGYYLLTTMEDALSIAAVAARSVRVDRDWGGGAVKWKYADRSNDNTVEMNFLTPAQLAELALKENT
jgi:hypothetical protein